MAEPSSVWAGCGDYVVIGNPSAAAREHQRATARTSAAHTPGDHSAPGACHGLHCGRNPRPSSPQAPTPPPQSLDRLATLTTTDLIDPLSHELAITGDTRVLSRGHLLGPDPPPRS